MLVVSTPSSSDTAASSAGGDPNNQAIELREGDHVRLSPRRSFERWSETVRGHCEPPPSRRWTAPAPCACTCSKRRTTAAGAA